MEPDARAQPGSLIRMDEASQGPKVVRFVDFRLFHDVVQVGLGLLGIVALVIRGADLDRMLLPVGGPAAVFAVMAGAASVWMIRQLGETTEPLPPDAQKVGPTAAGIGTLAILAGCVALGVWQGSGPLVGIPLGAGIGGVVSQILVRSHERGARARLYTSAGQNSYFSPKQMFVEREDVAGGSES